VTVAALPSLAATLVPGVIARMQTAHPGIVVVIRDALAERALAILRADEADLALTSAPPPDRELAFTPLFADRMVAVLPHAHPLAQAPSVRLADLLDSPLILMDRDSSVRRIVDGACASIGRLATPATKRPSWRRPSAWCARDWARRSALVGVGAACRRRPRRARSRAPRIERELGLVKQRRRSLSPASQAFVTTLTERARDTRRSPPRARVRR
jgi:DNA-binding transcriptional LysR family regulator